MSSVKSLPPAAAGSTPKPRKASTPKKPVDDAEQLQELIDLIKSSPPSDAVAAAAASAAAPAAAAAPASRLPSGSKAGPSILTSHSDSALPTSSSALPASAVSSRSKRPKNAEESRLDAFLLRHSRSYEFVGEGYAALLSSLLEGRLLRADWIAGASREHRLRVLRAVRVLSRDPSLQASFLRARPLGPLAQSLRGYASEYFASACEPAYCAESVVEICSILKRVSAEEAQDKRIFELSFLGSLVQLLAARDAQILQAVLVTLVNLSGSPMFVEKAMELPVLEPLLAILDEFTSLSANAAAAAAVNAGSTAPTPTGAGAPIAAASPAGASFSQSQPLSATSVRPTATPAVAAASAPTYHFLCAELLDLLSEYHECRQEIHLLSGNAIFLRLLHKCSRDRGGSSNSSGGGGEGASAGEQMALPILRCIANQALEPESSREIRFLGGIQLLLGLIAPMPDASATTPPQPTRDGRTSLPPPTTPPSEAVLIGACICLTQLALDDENAYQIRKVQGVYALGLLFLRGGVLPPSSAGAPTPSSRDVQAHACRALRFLYSVERNRKVFKRLFPSADLFATFIDIGHYVHPLPAYEALIDQMAEMSAEARRAMALAFEELKLAVFVAPPTAGGAGAALMGNNGSAASALSAAAASASAAAAAANGSSVSSAPSSASSAAAGVISSSGSSCSLSSPPSIRGYQIQEILGKGAFGTVYQVAKENSDKLYAMKELSLREMQKNGGMGMGMAAANAAAPNGAGGGGAGSLSPDVARALAASTLKEVEILSQLDHPNIVRYYTSFFEGAYVYIVMELVEGSSLLDHINSFVEKQSGGGGGGGGGARGGGSGVAMSEESIWPIFIQLCLALCYMHMEKRVVHRDLTPSNIMINDLGRAKVTDFGLAKQTHNGTVLQSAVGTISFSCPEIIMHETYTDKADLWSLGCILYQMATGRPAFAGSNPLTVAQKIVAGSYEAIPSSYSPLFHEMVRRLLTVDPAARPDILAVSSLISPLLMAELDRVNIASERLTAQAAHEAEARRRERDEWTREKQTYRKWMATATNQQQRGMWAQQQAQATTAAASSAGSAAAPASSSSPPFSSVRVGSASASSSGLDGLDALAPSSSSSLDSESLLLSPPPSSSPLFRVSSSAVRPTTHDPLSTLLMQLHKLVYVSQLPPKSTRDLKRTVVSRYKHALFARPFSAVRLKAELQQIVAGSQDAVDASFELPHLDATALLTSPAAAGAGISALASAALGGSGGSSAGAAHPLTHEELQLLIEQVLEESGYYRQMVDSRNADRTE